MSSNEGDEHKMPSDNISITRTSGDSYKKTIIINNLNHPDSKMMMRNIYKESVELTFVYLVEGCGKT
jgi:hypothetical protein